MTILCVNIDHIATLRQARGGMEPSVLESARIAEKAGACGITVHLREDRRHIHDADVYELRQAVQTKLNLEMAATEEIIKIALKIGPDMVTLVPEKRKELTTEGGLDVVQGRKRLKNTISRFHQKGIPVSLFIAPDLKQVKASAEVGADIIELHTGFFVNASNKKQKNNELNKLRQAAQLAVKVKLGLNAGHGLNYDNVRPVAVIKGMHELNIGHSIISRAVFVGLDKAVKEMIRLIK
ncbi:MAG: pyridoxine 5'-phosphate synthase [bacterium]|nr:pyridoxine 5'-phosphate synthase [bacterium]MDD5353877.1 pyridoxine 5'-phosphate synthase [bacterium]MDD5756372.1 pyridoxine 5'-phosphate synthase [bacterium]